MKNGGKGWRGVETIGGDGSKTGQVKKKKGKHKSTSGICASRIHVNVFCLIYGDNFSWNSFDK